ncbi:MAG: DNA/RNA non-specific endonuclease [Candidatus Scalindua sp.]
MKLTVLLILLFISPSTAYPHSGRTDAQGGHTNKKTGEYHYHNKPQSKSTSKSSHAQAEPVPVPQENHRKHFIYGLPTGTPSTNNLIIRDIYALSSNDETKFADWVAYRLDEETVTGDVKTKRNWKPDPLLNDSETLEPADYKDANRVLKTDRGHQAPLASFKGTDSWQETNYLSNITPQKANLNQGVWKKIENKVRKLVKTGKTVYVMTGTLYERDMPPLPKADEPHKVPSGYWKIIIVEGDSIHSLNAASFIFDQDTPRSDKVINHLCTINEIEERSGLNFLHELNDDTEEEIENKRFEEWAQQKFN